MLAAVLFVAAVMSFMLPATLCVLSKSSSISSVLLAVSALTLFDISITLFKKLLRLFCSSVVAPMASSLKAIIIFPTLRMAIPINTVNMISQKPLTFMTNTPFFICTAVTMAYRTAIPTAVFVSPFLSKYGI